MKDEEGGDDKMKDLMKKIVGWVKCRFGYHNLEYEGEKHGITAPCRCKHPWCDYKFEGIEWPRG